MKLYDLLDSYYTYVHSLYRRKNDWYATLKIYGSDIKSLFDKMNYIVARLLTLDFSLRKVTQPKLCPDNLLCMKLYFVRQELQSLDGWKSAKLFELIDSCFTRVYASYKKKGVWYVTINISTNDIIQFVKKLNYIIGKLRSLRLYLRRVTEPKRNGIGLLKMKLYFAGRLE